MKQKSKQIFLIFNSLNIGGIENKIVDISNHLVKKHRVYILLKNKQGALLSRINHQVKIITPPSSSNIFLKNCYFPFWISQQINQKKPQLIMSFGNYSSICSTIAKFICRSKSPIIISEDSSFSTQMYLDSFSFLRRSLIKFTYPKANKIIVQSQAIKNRINKYLPNIDKKVIVQPNWLPLEHKISQVNNYPKTIDLLFIARFEPQKNPLMFIKIVKKIKINNPQIKAVMIGSGSLESQIRIQIKEQKLQHNIIILGEKSDKIRYFQQSKFFVLTSIHEGFPLTILEASFYKCFPICKNIEEIQSFFHLYKSRILFSNVNNAYHKIKFINNSPNTKELIQNFLFNQVSRQQSINFKNTIKLIGNTAK